MKNLKKKSSTHCMRKLEDRTVNYHLSRLKDRYLKNLGDEEEVEEEDNATVEEDNISVKEQESNEDNDTEEDDESNEDNGIEEDDEYNEDNGIKMSITEKLCPMILEKNTRR